jgi:RNA polymerase sigma-70 factor (ECF subfamily)
VRATSQPVVRPAGIDPDVIALVELARCGDREAFAALYDRYLSLVFRYVYFRVGSRQLAEDLTSETFLRALARIGRFTWQGRDLGAWLVTIARNLITDHYKSAATRLTAPEDVPDRQDDSAGPERAALTHLASLELQRAVQGLEPGQRECIVLRFFTGLSVTETAQVMGKPVGAVKSLQYRAVRTLARRLPGAVAA